MVLLKNKIINNVFQVLILCMQGGRKRDKKNILKKNDSFICRYNKLL